MRRRTLFFLTLLAGVTLAVLGFTLSAPIGPTESPVYSNPRVEFAPLMFLAGVVLIFFSAVVYEIVPDRWDK
jgi:prepilin signal peptidase PulO-like enzyme (type II secretory pathway)